LARSEVTVFVCISCREADSDERPGAALIQSLRDRISCQDECATLAIEPVECLAVCKRPCTVALAGDGKWTYVIGDIDKNADAEGVIAAARSFAASDNGIVPWKDRPDCFKKGVVSRTPPLGFMHIVK
jgi:predicted metal-binding protein